MRDQVTVLYTAVQAGIAVILWGVSGTGKTSALRQLSTALNRRLWAVSLPELEPTDMVGLPAREEVNGKRVTIYAPPRWAQELADVGDGIVLLDEMNRVSSQQMLNAAQAVIHDRRAGDLLLPPSTSLVGACNPTGRAGTLPLTSSFANRVLHVPWSVPFAEWKHGVESGWPAPTPALLPPNWRTIIKYKTTLVTDFLQVRPTLLNAEPDDLHDAGQAWPSGRTWEMAWTMLAALGSIGFGEKTPESLLAVRAAVGQAASDEWRLWITNLDLPDPEAGLADPDSYQLPDRQDFILVALDALTRAALDKSKTPKEQVERYRAAWKIVGRAAGVAKDLVIPCSRKLALGTPREIGNRVPKEIDAVADILKASGIQWAAERA